MSELGTSFGRSFNDKTLGLPSRPSRNENLEKLLVLLTTKVPDLANSVWETLDKDKEGSNENANEIVKLKKENEDLKKSLEIKRQDEYKHSEIERRYREIQTSADFEKKEKKEIEAKIEKLKQEFQNMKRQMEETIKKKEDEIKTLRQAASMTKEVYESRGDRRNKEQELLQKYAELEKQHRTDKEKHKDVLRELEETKTRLSQALGVKLLDSNPTIADLSDKYRPTKLAEMFSEIYDNEWTDAFERIAQREGDDEEAVVSALVSILTETKSFCEKEANKQMEEIQRALTKDENQVDTSLNSIINKQLKECRKQMAPYSGKQLFKKYNRELGQSTSSTARKAKLVQTFVKACFNLCWFMTVQDPPVVFGPEIRRGDSFDTDSYKAYTKIGKKVEFLVWPTLLLHKGGPVLCKGIAQGIADYSSRPRSAPTIDTKEDYREEIGRIFSSSNRNDDRYKEDITITKKDSLDDFARPSRNSLRNLDYERQGDKHIQKCLARDKYLTYGRENDHGFGNDISFLGYNKSYSSSESNSDICKMFVRDFQYTESSERPNTNYQNSHNNYWYREEVYTSGNPLRPTRMHTRRSVTRPAWKY